MDKEREGSIREHRKLRRTMKEERSSFANFIFSLVFKFYFVISNMI